MPSERYLRPCALVLGAAALASRQAHPQASNFRISLLFISLNDQLKIFNNNIVCTTFYKHFGYPGDCHDCLPASCNAAMPVCAKKVSIIIIPHTNYVYTYLWQIVSSIMTSPVLKTISLVATKTRRR